MVRGETIPSPWESLGEQEMISAIGAASYTAPVKSVQPVSPVNDGDADDKSGAATSTVTQVSADNRAAYSTAVTRSSPTVLAALTALATGE